MKLEIGYRHNFEIRKETYFHPTVKEEISILYLSDLHLNKHSKSLINGLKQTIDNLDPAIILLGGDYVDSKNGFQHLFDLFNYLSNRKHVYVIAGNHDYFRSLKTIHNAVLNHNLIWLEKTSQEIDINGFKLLLTNIEVTEKKEIDLTIHCLHIPKNITINTKNHHLSFAGHLHGCQFVFWKNSKGLYPGRFFYKWNILKRESKNHLYIISKGLGDTLPLRYNCKRDIIFTTIKKRN